MLVSIHQEPDLVVSSSQSFTFPLYYFSHWMHGLFPDEVLFLSSPQHFSPCCSHLNYSFFLLEGQCISFSLSLIFLKCSPISETFYVCLFFALFVSVFGSPCMYVFIRVLHFSFSFSLLQQCSIGLCPSLNYWFPWNIFLYISKNSSINNLCLTFLFLAHDSHLKKSCQFFIC